MTKGETHEDSGSLREPQGASGRLREPQGGSGTLERLMDMKYTEGDSG